MVSRRPTVSPCSELAGCRRTDGRTAGWRVLFQKRRGIRELMSSRMCLTSEPVDSLEVEIAASGEVGEGGIDE